MFNTQGNSLLNKTYSPNLISAHHIILKSYFQTNCDFLPGNYYPDNFYFYAYPGHFYLYANSALGYVRQFY